MGKINKIYIADVKLNEADKDYKKMIIVENNSGILFIENNLCVLSFMTNDLIDIIVKNKLHLIDIQL